MSISITRSLTWFLVPAITLLQLAVAGCDDSDTIGQGTGGGPGEGGCCGTGGNENTGGGPSATETYEAMIKAACERQEDCGYPILNEAPTALDCFAEGTRVSGTIHPEILDGRAVLSHDRLNTCMATLGSASCEDLARKRMNIDPACAMPWEGTLDLGEACRGGFVDDCKPGLECSFDALLCPGACALPPVDCIEGSCQAGEYCSGVNVCMQRSAMGDACQPVPVGWISESSCVADAYCASGVCVARKSQGDSCVGGMSKECADGYTCQCAVPDCSTGKVCAMAPVEAQECTVSGGCSAGLFCNSITSKCEPRHAEGESCPQSPGACGPGLVCAAGVCAQAHSEPKPLPVLDADADCTGGGVCPTGHACQCEDASCSTGVYRCLPGPALGEACAGAYAMTNLSPFVCSEGLCDVLGTFLCVSPEGPGEPCSGSVTLECAYQLCLNGACATIDETACTP